MLGVANKGTTIEDAARVQYGADKIMEIIVCYICCFNRRSLISRFFNFILGIYMISGLKYRWLQILRRPYRKALF